MMSLKDFARTVLPARALAILKRTARRLRKARVASFPVLTENAFKTILTDNLGLEDGDTVFIHASVDRLNLNFPVGRILPMIQEITGQRGTLLFPTYPRLGSYEFLSSGEIFDIRKTPSFTGLLSEIARREPDALRSLHPIKSVCAIGRHARELLAAHPHSVYPFDTCSPYYKVMEYAGKAVGIGVSTNFLSFLHTVEDALQSEFPVQVYAQRLFSALCINYGGTEEIVRTYAHDLRKTNGHDTPRFMKRHIASGVCQDLTIRGMKFFRADTRELFHAMVALAKEGITVYPRSSYSRSSRGRSHAGEQKAHGGA